METAALGRCLSVLRLDSFSRTFPCQESRARGVARPRQIDLESFDRMLDASQAILDRETSRDGNVDRPDNIIIITVCLERPRSDITYLL